MTRGPRASRRAGTGLGWPDPATSAPGVHPSGLGWPAAPDNGSAGAGQPAPDGGSGHLTAGPDSADIETSSVTPPVPGVSRETPSATDDHEHQELRSAPPPPVVAVVSRETPFALSPDVPIAEDYSIVDVVSRETDDTPIARAAETAVRVLSGRLGEPLPPPPHTRVLTVANQKGGVGKTTTTVNLAAALALQGAHVLVIDLDPQGNASTALGVDHHSDVPSVYDVVVEGRELSEVIAPVEGLEGLFCAPATIDLAGAEIELVSLVARESRLRRALDSYSEWCSRSDAARLDYVLIDCPPSLGLLTVNALVAAPEVLIPIQCEYYALEGVSQLLRNIEMVKAHLNPTLHVSTVLLTMYDARTRLAAQVADEVRTHFPQTVLRTTIPRSVRISEAPSYGQTVMTYDPGSTGALSYLEAAREMALRGVADLTAGETL
ncbi:MAG: chromosome partitioning protein [Actinomycetota bacterium]|nr:chromosome partitioning protein [Actinomycetota bacterium]